MITVTMNAPASFGGLIQGLPSGNVYNVPASGVLANVQTVDIPALQLLGFQPAPNTVSGVGTPATGVTAIEYGTPISHQTVLSINSVLPAIAGGASLGVGKLLYTLPAGAQIVESSHMSVGITQTAGHINANTPKVGLGSVVASGAVAVLNGTATFMDMMTEQTAANCTGTATVATTLATSSPFVFISAAAGSKSIFFNAAAAWAASGDPAALLVGTVTVNWKQMN